jgi:hypothetical protein
MVCPLRVFVRFAPKFIANGSRETVAGTEHFLIVGIEMPSSSPRETSGWSNEGNQRTLPGFFSGREAAGLAG